MNQLERRESILKALLDDGQVLVKELALRFNTSEVTLRADLKALEKEGRLKRFFGGARPIQTSPTYSEISPEVQIDKRYQINADAKHRIAAKAATLVCPSDTIILDSGSTTHLVAKNLSSFRSNTIITNNLSACVALMDSEEITLVVIGGTYRTKTKSLHGHRAEQSLEGIQADVLFVGADGLSPESGITTFNEGYAITEHMANSVKRVIAVVDSTKLGRVGFNKVLDSSRIHTLIIDDGITPEEISEFESKGIEIIIA
ncbi:DeoR/GlpR family DNA-binding transcription regulator [Vibrio parahaemolyticus]|uniref:DeoR/GlpR family DNA-binding transcription regulator n=1 Tax=Vibrio parahaemolyticus TaxID=670 RepID=UPI001123FF8A|nr:DeoR/GlpR family DNA-binding transcription regulator [Vibrio parahaemolyticus]MBM4862712.1 DeoR/GlpR transcriptional regulator [Vibrio parahaemolyticus]MBM4952078.1 DeoR/GlpR transcriptional regulator [Vibrio parahaemolyticus]MDA0386399.1 DeoR/GlpR family DNA-binding transcription regulator [Vibrio parahaemolyticus]MDA0390944.1 DeoR/GlpR family DNA-binding transcription regulator [Vibrio parahaemolyticus]MDA0396251.1 DeoR/GlpR family DNA-binding transcription regulator [Vibrio parahaemolyti